MKVGRNDPCPCGSGLKYKNCHLRSEAGNVSTDLLWRQQHELNQRLPTQLLRFVKETYGVEIVRRAWRDFIVDRQDEFDPDSSQLPIFMPWFYYEWRPMLDAQSLDAVADLPVAAAYLKRRGRYIEPLAARYVEAGLRAAMSFFEVLEVEQGESIGLRDVLTGDEVVVTEKTASKTARPGDIFLARVTRLDGLAVLDGCAPIVFPPLEKGHVIDLRNQLLKGKGRITSEVLREHCREILAVYHSTTERLLNAKMPELANTDGEPLAFCRVTYEVPSARAAFAALRHLALKQSDSDLLEGATFDAGGELQSVELPWLKKGNKQIPWRNTTLSVIRIDGRRVVAEVNSEPRARRFRRIADAKLPEGSSHVSTVIESVQAALEARAREHTRPSDKDENLNEPPEIQALLRDQLRVYYRHWLDIGVPALGGQTPREAVKTRDGREMVQALLLDLERREGPGGQAEINREIAADLRATLNLA